MLVSRALHSLIFFSINLILSSFFFFFFNDTATTEIYTLSLHDGSSDLVVPSADARIGIEGQVVEGPHGARRFARRDRKSTRLNSSHVRISYAVFCLKKKKTRSCLLKHSIR